MTGKNDNNNSDNTHSGSGVLKYFLGGMAGGVLGVGLVAVSNTKSQTDSTEKKDNSTHVRELRK